MRPLEPWWTAVAFLTRVPVPAGRARGAPVARSLVWFPLVGALVGSVVGAVQAVAAPAVNPLAAAALAVTVGALITGGFHEDGLGDTADGFGGGWNPEQRLTIMDDPRQGAYGVLAICCSVAIRVAALSSLTGWAAVTSAAAVHLLARTWAVAALALAPPARPGGLAGAARDPAGRRGLMLALAGWCALALATLGPLAFAVTVAAGLAATGAVVALAQRKIGGVTGDVLGAVEQGAEALGLVALAGVAAGRVPWWAGAT
jgi:adenosylcobinamide-GDP ribazoletransferase